MVRTGTGVLAHSSFVESFWARRGGGLTPHRVTVTRDQKIELAPTDSQTFGRLHAIAIAAPKGPMQENPLQKMEVGRQIVGVRGQASSWQGQIVGNLTQQLPAHHAIPQAPKNTPRLECVEKAFAN